MKEQLPLEQRKKLVYIIAAVIILASFFLRIWNADADPPWLKRPGDISDEGYWAHEARMKIITNNWAADEFLQGLASGPLTTALLHTAFRLFGVSLLSVRIVPIIFSTLTLIILYLFARRYWSEKISLTALALLAVNQTYFMYSRIGHVETILTFFLLLTFFFITKKHWGWGALGGITFALTVLTKLTAIYAIAAIALYYYIKIYKREISWIQIISFITGGAIIGLPFLYWYFLPNLKLLSPTLQYLQNPYLLRYLPDRLLNYFLNPVWGQPGIYFIFLFALILARGRINAFFHKTEPVNDIEKIAWSWLIGYSIILILWSDFADRRFIPFIIPLTIIAVSSLNHIPKTTFLLPRKKYLKQFILCVTIIPIGSAIVWLLGNIACINILSLTSGVLPLNITCALATKNQCALSMYTFTIIALIIIIAIGILVKNINSRTWNIIKQASLASILTLITASLLTTIISPATAITAIISLATGILLSFVLYNPHTKKILLAIFIITNLILIVYTLATPTFTVRDNSKQLALLAQPNSAIIGARAHALSLENTLHPVFWVPHWNHVKINLNIQQYTPKLLLIDPEEKDSWPTTNDVHATYKTRFTLQPGNKIIEVYAIQ